MVPTLNHTHVQVFQTQCWQLRFLERKASFQIMFFYSNIYPTRCNVTQFILSGNCSTCFGWYFHPSSGAHTTIYSICYLSHRYCYLPLSWKIWNRTIAEGSRDGSIMADSHIACRAHAVPLPCRAAKGLECVFPIWFTQCGRVWFIKMWSVDQTRAHCVNQMGKTYSKHLAARHGRRTAWARHAMCESALTLILADFTHYIFRSLTSARCCNYSSMCFWW
jgi:hypothetical protein